MADLLGADEFLQTIADLKDSADGMTQEALLAGGEVFRAGAQARAPVFSGFLETHIVCAPNPDNERQVLIGPERDAFWGLFVEMGYGPGHRRADPFLRPAIDEDSDAALEAAGAKLAELLAAKVV